MAEHTSSKRTERNIFGADRLVSPSCFHCKPFFVNTATATISNTAVDNISLDTTSFQRFQKSSLMAYPKWGVGV